MGSGSSKDRGAPTAEGGVADSAGGAGRSEGERRWRWMRVGSACFRLPSSTASSFVQENVREGLENNACEDKTVVKSKRWRRGVCWKSKVPQPRLATCSSSSCSGMNGGCQAQGSASHADPGDSSSSSTQTTPITWTSNSLSHSHARFCFNTDGLASNLERAASLGSPRAQSVFPGSYSVQNSVEDDSVHKDSSGSSDSRSGTQEGGMASNSVSSQDIVGNGTGVGTGITGQSQTDLARIGNFERRPSRRHRTQEPLEGSVRFSRTLSVGRLRDRVLRGPSFSDRFFGHASLEDRVIGYHDDGIGRRALRQAIRGLVSSDDPTDMLSTSSPSHPTSMPSSVDNSYDHVSETSQLGDASNRDILEHRSAFIERRRRIRSQVRALQQLGNRVENFPGHDRSCILSGQHQMGHCTCRMNSRPANQDDSRSSRSSISRIVMLAEALFEVLDEIHQQAVVLASRPSVSSIGSVPAPKEVVEHMPLRVYGRPGKHLNEEAAQCYICLMEYEEGDCVRILPCCHEFHRICVDKWLKEIHRVCPLCRGDVCTFGLPPA